MRIHRRVRCILTGNYRKEYYLTHQEHFDREMRRLLPEKKRGQTLLYAPTWTSRNRKSDWRCDYSCFFQVYPYVLDCIPQEYQVLVKLHPFMEYQYPEEVAEIKQRYLGHEQVHFLNDLPPIYPLLEQVDLYLGDYSSIGYDFLSFDRPLFFLSDGKRDLENDRGVYLYQAGVVIEPEQLPHLYSIIGKQQPNTMRREIYEYAFGPKKGLKELRQEIIEAVHAR